MVIVESNDGKMTTFETEIDGMPVFGLSAGLMVPEGVELVDIERKSAADLAATVGVKNLVETLPNS